MEIDLPETLPEHIALQAAHVYEQAMENREGSITAMRKTWARLHDLLTVDALRETTPPAALTARTRVRRVTTALRESSPKEARAIDDFVRSLK